MQQSEVKTENNKSIQQVRQYLWEEKWLTFHVKDPLSGLGEGEKASCFVKCRR